MKMMVRYAVSLLAAACATSMFTPLATAAICDGVSPASSSPVAAVRITTNLTKPLFVTAPPGDTHRVFILEQDGRIRIVKDGVLLGTSFLDVSAITRSPSDGGGDEQGLLGLAFSPNYASDGYFFIYHTDTGGTTNTTARYHVSANPDLADTATRTVLLTIPHPTNTNHNGGIMAFGPDDGYLYIGTGDGGSACDPPGNAQNTGELKGKMLRIDVIPAELSAPFYRIPPSNPMFSKPEIFSIGLRNPWRFSFDRQAHDLYIGDVGQGQWEEVDYRTAANTGNGANYGWDHYEGLVCPSPSCSDPSCVAISPRVDPVKVYNHTGGKCSITGGYVYRGCRMPTLASQGRYFYADYCAANIESFVISGGTVTNEQTFTSQLSPSIGGFSVNVITSWGEDAQGELYITDRGSGTGTGEVFKIVPVLRNLEVSGQAIAPGSSSATQFLLNPATWSWEDLALTSSHPIDQYRVYRNNGNGSGLFTCVFKTAPVVPPTRPPTVWTGGDPSSPSPDAVYSYVVTAVRLSPLEETSPGTSTSGAPRSLSPTACP